ncbi:MAG: phosphoribosyltransferase [Chitinivibrionales bacterium]|nr:phosphoribosyltransferase [Chitinivibrionales bacterium]
MVQIYNDRVEAANILSESLRAMRDHADIIVLGLVREGMAVAAEVARELHLPLDIFLVQKISSPRLKERAIAPVSGGGAVVLTDDTCKRYGPGREEMAGPLRSEYNLLVERERAYRSKFSKMPVEDKTVIITDDGMTTGNSMKVAATALREEGAANVIVAVPVASPGAMQSLQGWADDVKCPLTPEKFASVSRSYRHYAEMTDRDVEVLLRAAR